MKFFLKLLFFVFGIANCYSQNINVEPDKVWLNQSLYFRTFGTSDPSLQLVSTHQTYRPSLTFMHGTNFIGGISNSSTDDFNFFARRGFRLQTLTNQSFVDVLTVLNNGSVGVGNNPSQFARLDVEGNIRSASLDFTEQTSSERRPVFADKDGVLRARNTSNYYQSYGFNSVTSAGLSDYQGTFINRSAGFASFIGPNGPRFMYIPVNLPDGVKVTNVKCYLVDESNSNLQFVFVKVSHSVNSGTNITSVTTSGSSAAIVELSDDCSETITNQSNAYYLRIESVNGDWIDDNMKFHSAVITYQYQ